MLYHRQYYSPGPGNDLVVKEQVTLSHEGDLYLAFRATNPGPGWAHLNVTALRLGREVWKETYLGWLDQYIKPGVGQFPPHTVDRISFLQSEANETLYPDPWGAKPQADPLGPHTRTIAVVWPDNVADLFHCYPIVLPEHDQLRVELDVNMAGDNGKVRVFLGIVTSGHMTYRY